MTDSFEDATAALAAHVTGDPRGTNELFPLVYDRLHSLAGRYMRRERRDHVLQPTALVHEAYLRMVDITRIDWRERAHFFAAAATQMRRVLIEHARAASRKKRGGNPVRVTLDEGVAATEELSFNLLALDEALQQLTELHERQSRVAEMRIFAGMRVREVARVLGVSERTVKQDWSVAQAWLSQRLNRPGGSHDGQSIET